MAKATDNWQELLKSAQEREARAAATDKANSERAAKGAKDYSESIRREFRQSEDAGGGAALKGARHYFVDGEGTK